MEHLRLFLTHAPIMKLVHETPFLRTNARRTLDPKSFLLLERIKETIKFGNKHDPSSPRMNGRVGHLAGPFKRATPSTSSAAETCPVQRHME
eukprot:3026934-Amphidinium_carterae.1